MPAKRKARPVPAPWTPDEDAALAAALACGLAVDFWPVAVPGRSVAEMILRRDALKLARAPLI